MRGTTLLSAAAAATTVVLLQAGPAQAADADAETLLGDLTTKTESSAAYDRDDFNHWIDADSDGCDTRAEVLKLESSVETSHTGTCTITTGAWTSLYDAEDVTDGGDLDIDHMVPLKEAWISGAHDWTAQQREDYANDLGYDYSLIAVTASTNRSKSDQDPDSWLPPEASYECEYVKEWIAVKWRWDLTVDTAERSALEDGLGTCSSTSIEEPSKG